MSKIVLWLITVLGYLFTHGPSQLGNIHVMCKKLKVQDDYNQIIYI